MISLEQILEQYPDYLRGKSEDILKEYLQYKILNSIFNSVHANKLVFLGGTALRIVYEGNRFSEDLDFDTFNLSEEDFFSLGDCIKKELELEGLEVEVCKIKKDFQNRNATHVYIKIPKLLHSVGLAGKPDQKIRINLDSEPQNYTFKPEKVLLNKFEVFTYINCVSKNLLLSQKVFAAFKRNRIMGRDFYDIVYLYSIGAEPDFHFLNQKIQINSSYALKEYLINNSRALNFAELAKDVEPFLFKSQDKKRVELFNEFIRTL